MIEAVHADLSISAQCRLLALMRVIDASFLDMPWYGSWLMTNMGLSPIYQRPRTSAPHPQHRIYPYLLRYMAIERANQVWCADITCIPMRRGFLYLVATMDWATRKALARFGSPEIFNMDQGSQFTSFGFTSVLKDADIRISVYCRWIDNVFIERLRRPLKYECVYLHTFETGSELRVGLTRWIGYYNADRPHSGLAGQTPDEAYGANETRPLAGLAPPAKTLQLAA
jgi:putative transposase